MPDSTTDGVAYFTLPCDGKKFNEKYSGTNVDCAIDGNILILRIDTSKVIGHSESGNAMTASSGGFNSVAVGAGKSLKVSLNVMPG